MRNTAFLLLLILLFACNSQPKKTETIAVPAEKTSIAFKEKMHNFGSLTAGEIVVYTFEFTNTGEHNFVIESVESDCGCIHVNYKKQAVKPGDKGLIEIEFNTAGMVGKEFKSIEVLGNSKELKHLAIFAEVDNELIDLKY